MVPDTLIEMAGVRTGYGTSPILQGVDLRVDIGEIVAVIGRNGVGKSTMMRCLIGQLPVWDGAIRFRGKDIGATPPERRAQIGFGYIPQGREVFARMTVEENLKVGEMVGARTEAKRYDMIYEFFPILAERRRQKAGTMSGGQQQQLAIGRALIGNPRLLLLDEPSEGIQPSIVGDITRVMRRINKELGTTILLVEQNLDVILELARRCYVMDKGRIIAERQAHELADREQAARDLRI
jgi:branched-chain amino acid transport system ATP-binding protein